MNLRESIGDIQGVGGTKVGNDINTGMKFWNYCFYFEIKNKLDKKTTWLSECDITRQLGSNSSWPGRGLKEQKPTRTLICFHWNTSCDLCISFTILSRHFNKLSFSLAILRELTVISNTFFLYNYLCNRVITVRTFLPAWMLDYTGKWPRYLLTSLFTSPCLLLKSVWGCCLYVSHMAIGTVDYPPSYRTSSLELNNSHTSWNFPFYSHFLLLGQSTLLPGISFAWIYWCQAPIYPGYSQC